MLGTLLPLSDISSILSFIAVVLLLVFKKKFVFEDSPLPKKGKLFLISSAILLVSYSVLFFGRAYNIAHNPDYKYEEISEKVGFHIYQPSFIPADMIQETSFHIYDKEFAGKQNAVRAIYSLPLEKKAAGGKSRLIIITQVKVDKGFELESYIDSTFKDTEVGELDIQPVNMTRLSNISAYKFKRAFLSELYILTEDDILIVLLSPEEPLENLVQMADSLQ